MIKNDIKRKIIARFKRQTGADNMDKKIQN